VRVAAGTLLLFPAWLAHSVEPNASAKTRVSVSFNLMFPRFAETLAQPLWGQD
jgi:ectoine hydroxylase-related dioxygenase (phytanoyl-CoA dioxygenase family)